jgi:phosphate butyryltransferase
MPAIRSFSELRVHLQNISTRRAMIVINPADTQTREAVIQADDMGLTETIIIGDPTVYQKNLFPQNDRFKHILCADLKAASELSVELLKNNEAEFLMKGLVNTDVLLRAIINKEKGIVPFGQVVTFIAAMEIPSYPRLIFVCDPAVIPAPNLRQRTSMIKYAISMCHSFGIAQPRIALLHGTEKLNPKLCFMNDYQAILDLHKAGDFGDVIIDGPLDIFIALDPVLGAIKQIDSPIQGDADVLIFPGFESANIFYKSMMTFAGAQMGGILFGTQKPVILSSRSDNTASKFNSIALACLADQHA